MNSRLLYIAILAAFASPLAASPEFSPVFQDHMVVQRDAILCVWGTGDPHEHIHVEWAGEKLSTTCTSEGTWSVSFSPPCLREKAEKGLTLRASSKDGATELNDILIGDVWLASGQSNMAYNMNRFADARADSKSFDQPQLRFMSIHTPLHTTGHAYSVKEYQEWLTHGLCQIQWETSTPDSAKQFSAVAAYFAQHMQAELNIPIGIICNAVGGVGMESWISSESISDMPELRSLNGDKWLSANQEEFPAWMKGRARTNLAAVMKDAHYPLLHPFKPSFLHEHLLRPILPLALKGVIWYQGESNSQINNNKRNSLLLRTLISDWRRDFKRADLPFYMVQLPRIKDDTPLRAYWPEFREVQHQVAASTHGVELICALDLGEANADVHPAGKKEVGARLAKLALYHTEGYKQKSYAPLLSPCITACDWKPNEAILTSSAELCSLDDSITGWTYRANSQSSFKSVRAHLDGTRIRVELPEAPMKGAELRYHYSTFMTPSLVSKHGRLPLFPWRGKLD